MSPEQERSRPMQTIAALMADATAQHDAGRTAAAAAGYRAVLARQPDHGEALQRLGVLHLQTGDHGAALKVLDAAVAAGPATPALHSNRASALRRLGRMQEALESCMRALRLAPDFTDAYVNLVNILDQMQRYGDAIVAQRQLIILRPFSGEARLQLARLLILDNQAEAAIDALYDLLGMQPLSVAAYVNMGVALRRLGRHEEAETAYRTALGFAPDDSGLLSNLGIILQDRDRYAEAIDCFQRAIACQPNSAAAHLNLSVAYRDEMRIAQSVEAARAAIRHDPGLAAAHSALAVALLMQGNYAEGFAEYEWRSRMPDFSSPKRNFTTPVWDGRDMKGRTLVVHDEQGVGDALQFVRYLPPLRARGIDIVLECNGQLTRLLGSMPGMDRVVGRYQPLPPHDAHVSLLSLPHLLGARIDNIPANVPYLATEPALEAEWAGRLAGFTGLKVGLVWAGNPEFKADRLRSPGLAAFRPLLDVAGVSFFGLQKGAGRQDLESIGPLPACFTDLGPDIGDFADTAAIMANLDLVITSCTGPAHLAGALGRPTWTVLPFAPDWRWLEDRTDTIWYPTMRLFRQERRGDWTAVLARVMAALTERAAMSRE
ncbi:tetratricopeptide repeat protein [Niveispirillum fermenti]|uniref:tetratricopeptide repeat protein n=1 Tax=Niveispirillum fermenti TaxID=1233113 RepID=UPI003A8AF89A